MSSRREALGRVRVAVRFNVPPGWPTPPLSWTPEEDWLPDPEWPEPPEGWSFWSTALEGGGSLSVADRAALEAELELAEPGSYGCSVVSWWTAAAEFAVPSPVPSEPVPSEPVATAPEPVREAPAIAPVVPHRTTTVRRRNLLVAAVIVCALGIVGFQASRVLLVSDDGGGTEIPRPTPVSDTRVPDGGSSDRTSEAKAPARKGTTVSTDRPDLVAVSAAVPSSTSAPASAGTSAPTGARTSTPVRTTAVAATAVQAPTTTTAPKPKAAAITTSASKQSTSTRPAAPRTTTQTSLAAPTQTLVPATASAVPAGGGRS